MKLGSILNGKFSCLAINLVFLHIKVHSIEYIIFCLVLFGIAILISRVFKTNSQNRNPESYRKKEVIRGSSSKKEVLAPASKEQDKDMTFPTGATKEGAQIAKDQIIEDQSQANQKHHDFTLAINYEYPTLNLLEGNETQKNDYNGELIELHKAQIARTFESYNIPIGKIDATVGPTRTLYEITPAPGISISSIKKLKDELALNLATEITQMLTPVPGKGTIGIEVRNITNTIVLLKDLLSAEEFKDSTFALPIAIGKKMNNDNCIVDLAAMPHLLIAGSTGQGKSVCIDSILISLLYKKHPSELKLVLIDTKKVELNVYGTIEKFFLAKYLKESDAIITDMNKASSTLYSLCIEMENRCDLLKHAGVRNINEYNRLYKEKELELEAGHQYLPFIVVAITELADLIGVSKKEGTSPLFRLTQLGRASGIHLVIVTQRPAKDVITDSIKANIHSRIAFHVPSNLDSRTILDMDGAHKLSGAGDMLMLHNAEVVRLQGAFIGIAEVEKVLAFIANQQGDNHPPFLLPEYIDENEIKAEGYDFRDKDPLFDNAAKIIVLSQMGSTALLQRRMKIGYNRAGRLMDQLEAGGIVGRNTGSNIREVLIKTEDELNKLLQRY